MTLKELIENTLHIPVIEGTDVLLTDKCATIYAYSVTSGIAGDGEDEEPVTSVQVDLHYKGDTEYPLKPDALALRSAIRANFQSSIPTINFSYDSANHYWRAQIEFEVL